MKKILSLLITAIMLSTMIYVAIPTSAAGTKMELTPIVPERTQSIFQGTAELVTPLSWADELKGVKVTANSDVDLAHALAGYKITARHWYDSNPISLANATHILLYVKTPAATQLQPRATVADIDKDVALKVGAKYEYASLNDTEWSVGTTVKGGNDTYYSDIKFDGPFEGYIKFAIADLWSDGNWNVDPTQHTINRLDVWFSKLAQGESVIAGPVFKVTNDTDSTEFDLGAIEATPFTGTPAGNSSAKFTYEKTMPLYYTTAEGVKITATEDVTNDKAGWGGSWAKVLFARIFTDVSFTVVDTLATDVIVYVKINNANSILPRITTSNGYDWTLKAGATYRYAALGDLNWSEGTVDSNSNITFTDAFEGYIKLPIDAFYSGSTKINTANNLTRFDVWFKDLAQGESAVAGPFFLVTKNTPSTQITVPVEFSAVPIEVSSVDDFANVRSSAVNFSVDKIGDSAISNNLYKLYIEDATLPDTGEVTKFDKNWTSTEEKQKYTYAENEDGNEGAGGDATFIMDPKPYVSPKDAKGFMFYFATQTANTFSPTFEYEAADGGTKYYNLKPGATVKIKATGTDEWIEKTVEKGFTSDVMFGIIRFDSAFEGYIRVENSALKNDGNFVPSTTGDISRIKRIVARFKGIGADLDVIEDNPYGIVTVGFVGYITYTSNHEQINVTAPQYESGDVNYDFKVDGADLVLCRKFLLGCDTEATYASSDVSGNGTVDIIDLVHLKKILSK